MYYILHFVIAFLYMLPIMFTDAYINITNYPESIVKIITLASVGIVFGIFHFLINCFYVGKGKTKRNFLLYYPTVVMGMFILAIYINAKGNHFPYVHTNHPGVYYFLFFIIIWSLIAFFVLNFIFKFKLLGVESVSYFKNKIFLIMLLVIVITFLVTWSFELVKNELFTIKYGKQFENLPAITEEVGPCEYFKVIDYSETDAYLYYITSYEPNPIGFIVHLKYYNNVWNYHSDYAVWSTMGSADEAIWPYWWHYFTR